jgi:hypothetical protein
MGRTPLLGISPGGRSTCIAFPIAASLLVRHLIGSQYGLFYSSRVRLYQLGDGVRDYPAAGRRPICVVLDTLAPSGTRPGLVN